MAEITPQINPPAPPGISYARMRGAKARQIREPQVAQPRLEFPLQLPEIPKEEFELPQPTAGEEAPPEDWYRKPARIFGKGLEAIGKPFGWVNEHVEKPWASLLVLAKEKITPGRQDIEKALATKSYDEPWWDTMKRAYEGMELPKGAKFFLESSMPLWWVIPQSAIAKAAGVGLKGARALHLTKLTGAVAKSLKGMPIIRSALRESATSKAINAPFRVTGLFEDLRNVYSKFNLHSNQLIDDIVAGDLKSIPNIMDTAVKLGGFKPGARKLEVLSTLLTDDAFRKTFLSEALSVKQGLLSTDDFISFLGGRLGQHLAAVGGKIPYATNNMMSEAYAFWKAGVLTTPWYVAQNYFENLFRTAVSGFEPFRFGGWETAWPVGKVPIPYFKNLWSAIKNTPMPQELRNTALTAAARMDGFTSVGAFRASAQASLNDAKKALALATNEVEKKAIQASIYKYEQILATTPSLPGLAVIPAQTPTEAIMQGTLTTTREHPLTKWTNAALEKLVLKPEFEVECLLVQMTKGTEAAKAYRAANIGRIEKVKHISRRVINTPRALAGVSDSGGKLKVYTVGREKYLKAHKGEIPERLSLASDILDDATKGELKALGMADDQLKTLSKALRDARTPDDIKLAFADIFEVPIPGIAAQPEHSLIPGVVWNTHRSELQSAVLAGDIERIKAIGKTMKSDSWAHISDIRPNYEAFQRQIFENETDIPALKRIFKQLDDYSDSYLADAEETLTGLSRIFPEKFLKGEVRRRALVNAEIEMNRAETEVLKGLYLQNLKARGLTKTQAARAITTEMETTVIAKQAEARQLARKFTKETWAMCDYMKGKKPAEVAEEWAAWYDRWLAKSTENVSLVRKLSRNIPDNDLLWKSHDLAVSEIYRDVNATIATQFGLDRVLPKYSPTTWWLKAESDINIAIKDAIAAIPDAPLAAKRFHLVEALQDKAISKFVSRQAPLLKEWEIETAAMNFGSAFADGIMGNYAITTDLDTFMNRIVPFWYFPSRSIPYYLRTFAQKPYLLAHLERYLETTKESEITPEALVGYFPVHVGDQYYYINPFRPWMGYQLLGWEPMAGLGQPVVQQTMQMVNMMGIGFNPAVTWSLEAINKISAPQGVYLTRGEPMPLFPQLRWLQDLIGAKGIWAPSPEQAIFSQNIDGMPDWERRNLDKELARWIGNNPDLSQTKGWPYPRDIIEAAKIDPEAKEVVNSQIARMSRYGLLSVVLPIYNRRNAEEIKMSTDRKATLTEIFKANGKDPKALFEKAENIGFSPMMYLNKAQKREIYDAHPEWEPWQGLTRVGINPEEREMERQTTDFYTKLDKTNRILHQRLEVADEAFQEGLLSGYNWRLIYEDIQAQSAAVWDFMVGDGLAPDTTRNPGVYPLARVTPERVEYFRKKFSTSIPPIHPEDVALNYYYSIIPEIDPELGTYDYDTYFARKDRFLSSMPKEIQKYIAEDRQRSRYDSPVEEDYRVDREQLNTYFAIRRQVINEYPEYKMLLAKINQEQDPFERQKIKQQVNRYAQIVSERRRQLRLQDAKVEAMLYKWGFISTFLNPETPRFLS